MLKKISFLLLIPVFIVVLSLPVFALPDDDAADSGTAVNSESQRTEDEVAEAALKNIIADKYIESTSQFLVTITRPEGDENTFNRSYIICGVSNHSDIEVVLSVYNESSGRYEEYETTEGVSRWKAGKLFTKEVILKEGANKIKLVAYKTNEANNLNVGENVQVNKFTITVLKESLKDKILNGVVKIADIIENIVTK